MTKKNGRTANGTTYLLERDKHTTQPTRCATKHELVALHLLEQGAQGVSALSGLDGLHDLNLRNSVSLLRREHGIEIADAFFEHQHSGGGTVRLKNYWLADREGRSLQRLNELYAANDQIGFKITQRVDGRLILREAVKCLAMKAA